MSIWTYTMEIGVLEMANMLVNVEYLSLILKSPFKKIDCY